MIDALFRSIRIQGNHVGLGVATSRHRASGSEHQKEKIKNAQSTQSVAAPFQGVQRQILRVSAGMDISGSE